MPKGGSVAHSFIDALTRRGIEHVFANAGTDHAPIVEALCDMQARRANVPVLLVAGKNPLSPEGHAGSRSVPIRWGQDAFDQNALVREYTKWEHELRALLVSRTLGIPVLIIITKNGMWYAVEHSTIDIFPDGATANTDEAPLTQFGESPDYAMMARACGAHGETVSRPEELAEAIERWYQCNRNGQTAVIDVITAPGSRIA